jgi:hypothetical protein
MTVQPEQKSTVEKIREFPTGSLILSAVSVAALTESINLGMMFFAAPVGAAGLALSGALNAMDKKRSGLSRCFNAAAAVVGAVGAVAPFVIAGPAALGALFLSTAAMGIAGGFNLAAHFLRNKKLPITVSVKRDEEQFKPARPKPGPQ